MYFYSLFLYKDNVYELNFRYIQIIMSDLYSFVEYIKSIEIDIINIIWFVIVNFYDKSMRIINV